MGYHKITITGDAFLYNDSEGGETELISEQAFDLGPDDNDRKYQVTPDGLPVQTPHSFCDKKGSEVGVDVDVFARHATGSPGEATFYVRVGLFENTSGTCGSDELDGFEYSDNITMRNNETAHVYMNVTNQDEGGDFATVNMQLKCELIV